MDGWVGGYMDHFASLPSFLFRVSLMFSYVYSIHFFKTQLLWVIKLGQVIERVSLHFQNHLTQDSVDFDV